MQQTTHRPTAIVAILLISMVATQLIYFGLSEVGADINRSIIWTVESVAFLGISVFALVPLARKSRLGAVWAAIAVGGILNVIQVGMGLAMFGPLKEAGEPMAAAFQSILAGAFFLYFAGKFLFGAAAIGLGAGLIGGANGPAKLLGALAIITGLAAMVFNTYAMAIGLDAMFMAGATGTAATLLVAIALILADRSVHMRAVD